MGWDSLLAECLLFSDCGRGESVAAAKRSAEIMRTIEPTGKSYFLDCGSALHQQFPGFLKAQFVKEFFGR